MNEEDLDKLPSAKLSPFATDDLREIWLYISENSREFADKTIDMILQKCKFISSNPKIGRTRHDLIVDLRLFPYKNYNIYYLSPTTVLKFTASCIVRGTLSKYSMTR